MAAATEEGHGEAELRRALSDGAAGTRNAIRQLRSLLLEIYPPALHDQGLAAALPDLAAPLTARGLDVDMTIADGLTLPTESERLLFRTAQEAMRNAASHARAQHVRVRVDRRDDRVVLSVSDDGQGFDPGSLAARRAEGHLGLALLDELATSAGGHLHVDSAPGQGTTVEVEVPAT
jgi:signal transduction histidine kinase